MKSIKISIFGIFVILFSVETTVKLYSIGDKPAFPHTIKDGKDSKHWLPCRTTSGVLLTWNPVAMAKYYGVSGAVYSYKVPIWLVTKLGGLSKYYAGSKICIPEKFWKKIKLVGLCLTKDQLKTKIDT